MHPLETRGASRPVASFEALHCPLLAARFALSALCVGLSVACGAVTCPDGSLEVGGKCQEAEVLGEDIQGNDDAGASDASALEDDENEDADADADVDAQAGEDGGFEPGPCDAEEACEPGAELACLTVCGTEGRGTCSETCSEPTVDTCKPPAEVCNWVDDDCDGVVDPGLLEAQSGLQAFTAEGAREVSLSELSFVQRADGGQWLLYSDAPTFFVAGEGKPIYARQVDADGRAVGALSMLSGSARTLRFKAAGDGKWLAVLAQQRDSKANDSIFIKLILYRASDLTFVAERTLVSLLDSDEQRNERDDEDDCHFASIGDVALREDASGAVQMLAAYATAPGKPHDVGGGLKFCNSTAAYDTRVTRFSYSDTWHAPQRVLQSTSVPSTLERYVRVRPVPCRDEWMALYATSVGGGPLGWTLARISAQGAVVQSTGGILEAASQLYDVGAHAEDCDVDPEIYVAHQKLPAGVAQQDAELALTRLVVDRASGLVSALGTHTWPAGGGRAFAGASVLHTGGRTLLAAVSAESVQGTSLTHLALYEQAGQQQGFRALGSLSSEAALGLSSDLAVVDRAVVFASSAFLPTSLNAYRDPGDTNPAVGALYRYGCGE